MSRTRKRPPAPNNADTDQSATVTVEIKVTAVNSVGASASFSAKSDEDPKETPSPSKPNTQTLTELFLEKNGEYLGLSKLKLTSREEFFTKDEKVKEDKEVQQLERELPTYPEQNREDIDELLFLWQKMEAATPGSPEHNRIKKTMDDKFELQPGQGDVLKEWFLAHARQLDESAKQLHDAMIAEKVKQAQAQVQLPERQPLFEPKTTPEVKKIAELYADSNPQDAKIKEDLDSYYQAWIKHANAPKSDTAETPGTLKTRDDSATSFAEKHKDLATPDALQEWAKQRQEGAFALDAVEKLYQTKSKEAAFNTYYESWKANQSAPAAGPLLLSEHETSMMLNAVTISESLPELSSAQIKPVMDQWCQKHGSYLEACEKAKTAAVEAAKASVEAPIEYAENGAMKSMHCKVQLKAEEGKAQKLVQFLQTQVELLQADVPGQFWPNDNLNINFALNGMGRDEKKAVYTQMATLWEKAHPTATRSTFDTELLKSLKTNAKNAGDISFTIKRDDVRPPAPKPGLISYFTSKKTPAQEGKPEQPTNRRSIR